jgi:hypothetical protein
LLAARRSFAAPVMTRNLHVFMCVRKFTGCMYVYLCVFVCLCVTASGRETHRRTNGSPQRGRRLEELHPSAAARVVYQIHSRHSRRCKGTSRYKFYILELRLCERSYLPTSAPAAVRQACICGCVAFATFLQLAISSNANGTSAALSKCVSVCFSCIKVCIIVRVLS